MARLSSPTSKQIQSTFRHHAGSPSRYMGQKFPPAPKFVNASTAGLTAGLALMGSLFGHHRKR